jgi:PAS domain S-box-containing protein
MANNNLKKRSDISEGIQADSILVNDSTSELKEPEDEVLNERFLLQSLMQYIPDSIYFKDRQSKIIKVSNNMATWFNKKDTLEFVGKTDFDFQDALHAQKAFADEQKIVESGEPLIGLIEKEVHTDGTIKWVSTSKLPLKDDQGNIIGVYGISRNVTELVQLKDDLRKKNEELMAAEEEMRQNLEELKSIQERLLEQQKVLIEKNKLIAQKNSELAETKDNLEMMVSHRTKALRIAKEQAEESDRLKSAFLENLSHEIRTPMNSILGFSQILLKEDAVSDEIKNYLCFINTSADSLMQLINDIVDLSLLESGQFEFKNEQFALNSFIAEIYSTIAELKPPKEVDIILHNEIETQNLFLFSDKTRIMQVLFNLLSNAIKFTHEGSVTIKVYIENEFVTIAIKDTGIGIASTELLNIFDRFRKIDSNVNKLYRGAGLGLTISKKIALALGGNITVQSALELGSLFSFLIPLSKPTRPTV